MRTLPPTTLQKNFNKIEQATLKLQDAGVDLPQLAINLRKLDRTRMLSRSLQNILHRETSSAFSRILQVKQKRSRALHNVNSRLKARLLFDISNRIQVDKSSQKYFFKWFLKSNPQIIRKVTNHILIKQKLSHKVVCWRLTYLARVHKQKDKKQDLLWILQGIMKLGGLVQHKQMIYKKDGLDRMSPRYHNKAFQIMGDIIRDYQIRRTQNLRDALARFRKMTTRVARLHKLIKSKTTAKIEKAVTRLKNWNNRNQEKDGEVKTQLKNRRKDEIISLFLNKRASTDRRDALRKLQQNLNAYRSNNTRQQTAAQRLKSILQRTQLNNLRTGFNKFKHITQNLRDRENVVKGIRRRLNLKVGNAVQRFELFKTQEANQEKEEVKSKQMLFRGIGVRTDDKLWKAFWKLRLSSKFEGKSDMLTQLKKAKIFKHLVSNTKHGLRQVLNRLRENNLMKQHQGAINANKEHNLNAVIKRKLNGKAWKAFQKLRQIRREENQEIDTARKASNRLARMLNGKGSLLKYLALRKLRTWRRTKQNQTRSALRLILKLNQHRKNTLREAYDKLVKLNQQESLKEKMEEMGNAVQEVKNNYTVQGLLRNLFKNQGDRKALAFARLRDFNRDQIAVENLQNAKTQRPLGLIIERLMGKKAIAFYKLLRCFGDGDQAYRKRRQDISLGGISDTQGWLKPQARQAFIDKVGELLGKRPINNVVVDAVEKYVNRKETAGDMEGVRKVLQGEGTSDTRTTPGQPNQTAGRNPMAIDSKHNILPEIPQHPTQTTTTPHDQQKKPQSHKPQLGVLDLIKGLKNKAQSGDPHAQDILDKINNRHKMRLKDLELFMNDRNETAKYTKLVNFMDETPDLNLYEFAAIIKKNANKRKNLWPIMEEVDEASDKERLLRYLERNNESRLFDDIIRDGRSPGTRFSDILDKLDQGNRGGDFEMALDFVNNDGIRLKDKLVAFLMEMNGKTGKVFKPLLKQINANPDLTTGQIYERAQEALDGVRNSVEINPRLVKKVSDKIKNLINQNHEELSKQALDYITHCNKLQKGRFNDLVRFANDAQDQDNWGQEEMFQWFATNWGVNKDNLYAEVDLLGEGDIDLQVKRRDLVRALDDSDRKKRWQLYLKERPTWTLGQDLLAELNQNRNWKLTDFFKKLIQKQNLLTSDNQEDTQLAHTNALINWDGRSQEIENFLIHSNEGSSSHILDDILFDFQQTMPYLDILEEVFETNQNAANQHIINFINRDTNINIPTDILKNLRVKGQHDLVRQIEHHLPIKQDLNRPAIFNVLRDQTILLEDQLENAVNPDSHKKQIAALETLINDLQNRNDTPGLMDQIENYMRLNPHQNNYEPLKKILEQKAQHRAQLLEEQGITLEEQIPELEDLLLIMNQNPSIRDTYPEIDRLLNEKNKNPKFQHMFHFLKNNNKNGKYFPLLKELDYKRLLEARERNVRKNQNRRRSAKLPVPELIQPTLMDMARLLKSKAQTQPDRFQDALDHFDNIQNINTAQKLGNFMMWTTGPKKSQNIENNPSLQNDQQEDPTDFNDLIKKLSNKDGINLTDAFEEIIQTDQDGELEPVWDRINEDTLGNPKLLEFMQKTPEDEDKYGNIIQYINTHSPEDATDQPGLLDILDIANSEERSQPGKMKELFAFIDHGGLDIESLNLDSSDPLFKFLETSRALGQNPLLFEKLKNGLLKDPEELLTHLKRTSDPHNDPHTQHLIRQLQAYCKRHTQFPDYGTHNQKHIFFKVIKNYLKPYFRKLIKFSRDRGKADSLFNILLRKNHEIKSIQALNHLKSRNAQLTLNHERQRGALHKKNSSLKHLFFKMYSHNTRSAFLRLRAHKTSNKYRNHVTKSLKERFWGILIRSLNPGIYKAYHKLKKFKNQMIIQNMNKTRKMRKFILKLNHALKHKRSLTLKKLQLFAEKSAKLEKIKKRLANSTLFKWNSRLKETLWNLRNNRTECEQEEDEMEETVKMVFARAGHRAQLRQLRVMKDLQIKGVQKQLIHKNILNKIFGNANRNEIDLKRFALNHLRDFAREERNSEHKINNWGQLALYFSRFDKLRALTALREHVKKENIKMSLNSLFKWKAANMHAKNETVREMESLVSLYKGALIGRLDKSRISLMRDALNRLRLFLTQNKGQVGHMMRKLIHATAMKKTKAFHALKDLNRAFNLENSTADKMMARLLRSLNERRLMALNQLRTHTAFAKLKHKLSTTILTQYAERSKTKHTAQVNNKLAHNARLIRLQRTKLNKILQNMTIKRKRENFMKWRDLLRQELICRFNSKITSLCLCLRKNHRFEARSALERWSQKKQKLKYEKLAAFLESAKGLQKRETYTHMKIHHMQKKFSSMCKVWGRLLDFVETRKKENIMYAFDAMSLDNPWADRVPQLLACGQVMSAQMCFWKLRLTRKHLLKKRRQRATNYKIEKVKLVFLESIFSKKISQYFMNIQMARRNKYL